MDERTYDQINNEGGEGYNPYRARRQEDGAKAARAAYRRGEYEILHDLEICDCSIARESGTYDAERVAALRAELVDFLARRDADFLAIWPLELTRSRRAAWNARVRSGEFGAPGKKYSGATARANYARVEAACREQGWRVSDLRRAVELHEANGYTV